MKFLLEPVEAEKAASKEAEKEVAAAAAAAESGTKPEKKKKAKKAAKVGKRPWRVEDKAEATVVARELLLSQEFFHRCIKVKVAGTRDEVKLQPAREQLWDEDEYVLRERTPLLLLRYYASVRLTATAAAAFAATYYYR